MLKQLKDCIRDEHGFIHCGINCKIDNKCSTKRLDLRDTYNRMIHAEKAMKFLHTISGITENDVVMTIGDDKIKIEYSI